jgi:hypothetical protein
MGSVNEVSGPATGRATNFNSVAVEALMKVNARLVTTCARQVALVFSTNTITAVLG